MRRRRYACRIVNVNISKTLGKRLAKSTDMSYRSLSRQTTESGEAHASSMTWSLSSVVLFVIGVAFGVACAPVPTPVVVPSPPIVTVLAHGIASSAVITADEQQVLVGETQLGARPADTMSRVLNIPLRGGQSQIRAETQRPGAITGLAEGSDGTLFVSRWADPLSLSTISAYRAGSETILVRATTAPPDAVSLRSPAGLALTKSGDLLVADTVGSQVLRITAGGQLERVAGTGSCPSGPLTAPVPGAALATALCGPELLARDDQGNIYVAPRGGRWIAKVDSGGALTLLVPNNDVAGLTAAPLGALLVSDTARGEIIRFQSGRSSVAVTGIDRPTNLAVGPDGAIVVLASRSGDLLRVVVP